MRFSATIFVEGKADMKFISDFVKNRFEYNLKEGIEVLEVGGKDRLYKFKIQFTERIDQGLTNLVIYDADQSFIETRNALEAVNNTSGIQFENFLFPNNEENGDLEVLLEKIVNDPGKPVIECIDNFFKCLDSIKSPEIKYQRDRKSRIYAYASILTSNDAAKESNRDYLNINMWNLKSDSLKPLYDFLKPYFTNE